MVHLLGKSAAGGADASTTWLERSEPASSHVTSGRGEEEEEEEGGGGRRRARAGRSAGRAAAAARGHRRRPPPPRRGARLGRRRRGAAHTRRPRISSGGSLCPRWSLQMGQSVHRLSHSSTQLEWNTWRHGNRRHSSPI
ncbi:unnamed protein product [Prorocentrum cordatum]|uniref:Uncharacterized protein n=1 Tax=Prorocentrum cordatum TaxID=2364126 RepID=A0ABN9UI24_9DINO|nr:unnamed protein product [Polarella glacialis]